MGVRIINCQLLEIVGNYPLLLAQMRATINHHQPSLTIIDNDLSWLIVLIPGGQTNNDRQATIPNDKQIGDLSSPSSVALLCVL